MFENKAAVVIHTQAVPFLNMEVTGTNLLNEDFIFTNYYYEINPKFTKKYHIPDNYEKIYTLRKGNVLINDLYIKK